MGDFDEQVGDMVEEAVEDDFASTQDVQGMQDVSDMPEGETSVQMDVDEIEEGVDEIEDGIEDMHDGIEEIEDAVEEVANNVEDVQDEVEKVQKIGG